ncbi:MAG: arginine--tRNA ligase [Actinomycetia bacterium]|nr:arginine--tRNA ligase [Actinomycetes bacterium]
MTPAELSSALLSVLDAAVASGDLDVPADRLPASVTIERPRSAEHGDYATNVALQLAKSAGRPPREVASVLATRIQALPGIAAVDVAGPGFLNITLEAAAQGELARTIVGEGEAYGRGATMSGVRVNVEFISANPNGPLHLGHTRWAAVGDSIARVLEAAGADVAREFYINDRGVQMDRFGESLREAANGRPAPEDGYHGGYITDLAAAIVADHPEYLDLPAGEQLVVFREAGYVLQLKQQQDVLTLFRTEFDVWYSERSLYESGAVERGLVTLREQGHSYELDGALWLRTTDFDDDKDRVLIKSDGETTYFASDSAYYLDKRVRGFDINIYLLGADHHGYVNRLRAIAACAGDDPNVSIEVLIGQLVKMYRGGQEVRLSKRKGDIVTLEDLVDEVGVDAARYTLCRYPVDTPLSLDLDLLVKQTNDNPVYYVQYAHARISSLLRNAAELGLDVNLEDFDAGLLVHAREGDLLGSLGQFPRVVTGAAELREPHRVARYLEELASAYHKFYDSCRVLPRGDEEASPTHSARLVLCAATRQVLANGLALLGVTAPERM